MNLLKQYDAIVFGGWCMAVGVTKLGWFKNQIAKLSSESKNIMVYMVSASPAESPDIPLVMERNFSGTEW